MRMVAQEASVVRVVGIGGIGGRAGRIGGHPEGRVHADVGAFAGEVEVVVVFVRRGGRERVRGWQGIRCSRAC